MMRNPYFTEEYEMLVERIGTRISELRKEQGMSRVQLAVEADVTAETIRRIELGHGCTVGTLARLMLALDCGFADLEVDTPLVKPALPASGARKANATKEGAQ